MKTVLGIVASPRKNGNCGIIIKSIYQAIPQDKNLSLLRLSDFNIKPCKACYLCLFKKERCIQRDDYYQIVDALLAADGLIVTAPTYFLGPNSALKRFLDRGLALYAFVEKLWAKPAVGVAVAGIEDKSGYTELGIESFLRLILTDVKGLATVFGALPGEAGQFPDLQTISQRLGEALFGAPLKDEAPSCPVCGGSDFRFDGQNRIRCLLCSNSGTVSLENGTPSFQIQPDRHGLFLSLDDALEHREWLRREVKRYSDSRDTLKKIQAQYRDIGHWI